MVGSMALLFVGQQHYTFESAFLIRGALMTGEYVGLLQRQKPSVNDVASDEEWWPEKMGEDDGDDGDDVSMPTCCYEDTAGDGANMEVLDKEAMAKAAGLPRLNPEEYWDFHLVAETDDYVPYVAFKTTAARDRAWERNKGNAHWFWHKGRHQKGGGKGRWTPKPQARVKRVLKKAAKGAATPKRLEEKVLLPKNEMKGKDEKPRSAKPQHSKENAVLKAPAMLKKKVVPRMPPKKKEIELKGKKDELKDEKDELEKKIWAQKGAFAGKPPGEKPADPIGQQRKRAEPNPQPTEPKQPTEAKQPTEPKQPPRMHAEPNPQPRKHAEPNQLPRKHAEPNQVVRKPPEPKDPPPQRRPPKPPSVPAVGSTEPMPITPPEPSKRCKPPPPPCITHGQRHLVVMPPPPPPPKPAETMRGPPKGSISDGKGGWYLPNQGGFLDKDGVYHEYLGFKTFLL